MRLKKITLWILGGLCLLIALLAILIWAITFHPADVQAEPVVCADNPPMLKPGQPFKVLNYNVQFMAGKNYVFFFDVPNHPNPDKRPSPADITKTLHEVVRIIQAEDPDIILLQEVNNGSSRTYYEDQLARLLPLLSKAYVCHTAAFFWKAAFIPDPRIMGAEGWKQVIISKYRISEATRHQLALVSSDNFITRQFKPKRAVLEVRLPREDGQELIVFNAHLSAFAQGDDTMQKQVAQVDSMLDNLNQANIPWIIGGDLNLLPPGQYEQLQDNQKIYYQEETELDVFLNKYQGVPGPADLNGQDHQQWFTYFPNDPSVSAPDRTIDYIFFSDQVVLTDSYVRHHDTLTVSDHLPVIAEFQLP